MVRNIFCCDSKKFKHMTKAWARQRKYVGSWLKPSLNSNMSTQVCENAKEGVPTLSSIQLLSLENLGHDLNLWIKF